MKFVRAIFEDPPKLEDIIELDGTRWKWLQSRLYNPNGEAGRNECEEYVCVEDPTRHLMIYLNGPKEGDCDEWEGEPAALVRSVEIDMNDVRNMTIPAHRLALQAVAYLHFCESIAAGKYGDARDAAHDFYEVGQYAYVTDSRPECLGDPGEPLPAGWTFGVMDHMLDCLQASMNDIGMEWADIVIDREFFPYT